MQSQQSFIERENENGNQGNGKTTDYIFAIKRILCDRKTPAFVIFIMFTVTVPILVFYFLLDQRNYHIKDTSYTCFVDPSYRVPCGHYNITPKQCEEIMCCFNNNFTGCYHSIPSRYTYRSDCDSDVNCIYRTTKIKTPLQNKALPELKLTYIETDSNNLQIILHAPSISYNNINRVENKNYKIKLNSNILGIEVFRSDSEERLLTTFRGPVIASDGYWEWSMQLTKEKLFGLGELLLEANKTVSKVFYRNQNDYNMLANFMAYSNGSYHGVAVEHEGPLEITVLPSRLITMKSLAGNKIVLKLSVGPTPKDVVKQQRLKKAPAIPYWVLGAHICRDGKATLAHIIEEYKNFTQNEEVIEFVSDCIHENLYGMLNDIEENQQIDDLLRSLKNRSHFVMSVPPQIFIKHTHLYNRANNFGILYKQENGETLIGAYLQEDVAYPDFAHNLANTWGHELNSSSLPFRRANGFVLRDNWPIEEKYEFTNENNTFPYLTKTINSTLSSTLPWYASSTYETKENRHILKHNDYGIAQASLFKKTFNSDFLMTSSYDNELEGATVLIQNVNISWTNLKKAISVTLYHSLFGSPLLSVPVCGSTNAYNKELHEQLCMRWYIVAATLPIFRISSELPRRDPLSLATGFAQNVALKSLKRRYMLLPYYYSIINEGNPLTRPMFYDFYFDPEAMELDEQYMLGDALLVAQPLLPDITNLRIYLPQGVECWYEFWGGMKYTGPGWIKLYIVEDDWLMFIAEGRIVPTRLQKHPTISSISSEDTLSLAIAFNCSTSSCHSEGSLYLGKTRLNFFANETCLTVSNIIEAQNDLMCKSSNHIWPHTIADIKLYGIKTTVVAAKFSSVNLCNLKENEISITFSI